jgi:hypothetical protein
MTGCQKENEMSIDNKIQNSLHERLFFPIDYKNVLSEGFNSRSPSYPSLDLLVEIGHKLQAEDSLYNFADSLIEAFGFPLWNYSILKGTEDSEYIVSIPFDKIESDSVITGILKFYHSSNGEEFRFIGKYQLDSLWQTAPDSSVVDAFLSGAVVDFFIVENNLYEKELDSAMIAWRTSIQFSDENRIQPRGYWICIEQSITDLVLVNASDIENKDWVYSYGAPSGNNYNFYLGSGQEIITRDCFYVGGQEWYFWAGSGIPDLNLLIDLYINYLNGQGGTSGGGSFGGGNYPPTPIENCLSNNFALNAAADHMRAKLSHPCNPNFNANEAVDYALMAACDDAPASQLKSFYNSLPKAAYQSYLMNDYIKARMKTEPNNIEFLQVVRSSFNSLICNDENVIADRAINLVELLEADELALLRNCLANNPSIDIEDYTELFNFEMPTSCIDRLNTLGEGWAGQPIQDGNVSNASLDYYPVKITVRPDFNDDNVPDNDYEIFEAIRLNFLDLADGDAIDFESLCIPYPNGDATWDFIFYDEKDPTYVGPDKQIWPSQSPITTIFYIDAHVTNSPLMNALADDGAVIVSDYCPYSCWTFSTIETPKSKSQPLAGNRQWGLTTVNGDLTFYNRAADRARIKDLLSVFTPGCAMNDYYRIGVETWKDLQDHVKEFIESNSGQAVINPLDRFSLNPNFEELYNKLHSQDQIISIPCFNH